MVRNITGAKVGVSGKVKMFLLDPEFTESVARVLAFGEDKHGSIDAPGHWMNGMLYEDVIAATERHINRIKAGEDIDPESGEPHTSHVSSNMMYLDWYRRKGLEKICDNRRYKEKIENASVQGTMQEGSAGDEILPIEGGEVRLDLPEVQLRCEKDVRKETSVVGMIGSAFGYNFDPLVTLQKRIDEWASKVIPNRTAHDALQKLVMEEMPELLSGGLDDPYEWADCLILLLDIAKLRGIDPVAAAHEKMTINEGREWYKDETTGLMKHVRGS